MADEINSIGYCAQLHKDGIEVTLLSKSGKDFTARFKPIAKTVALLKAKHLIVDAEIVANVAQGALISVRCTAAPRKA